MVFVVTRNDSCSNVHPRGYLAGDNSFGKGWSAGLWHLRPRRIRASRHHQKKQNSISRVPEVIEDQDLFQWDSEAIRGTISQPKADRVEDPALAATLQCLLQSLRRWITRPMRDVSLPL